ncbi:MAG: PcfJ domain-containing protein [Arenicella sp.]|nr:PcfJ domain-containing protein [Arenicella sp.]
MKRKLKNSTYQSKAIKPSMKKHMKALGVSNERAYVAWCAAHNFDTTLHKSRESMGEEYDAHINGRRIMNEQARVHHNPDRFIRDVCLGRTDVNDITRSNWREVGTIIAKTSCELKYREGLLEFLLCINKKAKFVFETATLGNKKFRYIQALIYFYDCQSSWIREIEEWEPRTHNIDGQFKSLVSYLFERCPAPCFMVSAWFRKDTVSDNYRAWYLHLASGKNIRSAELPIEFTKKMAHNFMQAPSYCSIEQAITWGHIHALGGDKRLADAVLSTRVGETLDEHKFWTSVYSFFVDNPMLDRVHVGPIIDYLHAQKFEVRECVTAPGVVEHIYSPKPNLSMRGRKAEALLKQVDGWHGNLAKSSDAQKYFFKKSGIPGYKQKTGEDKQDIWRIRELLSGAELIKEGREMQHCVASYARACAAGRCSIWAMEYVSSKGIHTHQTIEVSQLKQIVQCRGKRNAYPTKTELNIIRKWGQTVGLSMSPYVVSRG